MLPLQEVDITIYLPVDDYSLLAELAAETDGLAIEVICAYAVRRFLVWKIANCAVKEPCFFGECEGNQIESGKRLRTQVMEARRP